MKIEKLLEDKLDNEVSLSESLKGLGYVFLAVICFGAIADKIFHSKEKAQEARDKGYDV